MSTTPAGKTVRLSDLIRTIELVSLVRFLNLHRSRFPTTESAIMEWFITFTLSGATVAKRMTDEGMTLLEGARLLKNALEL